MSIFENSADFAQKLDAADELNAYRERFYIPPGPSGVPCIYFCGNSLGLQPKSTADYIAQELEDWKTLGVEGHLKARRPWAPYHEFLTEATARLVGAKPSEVVVMNQLTVNLHLLMVSFYRPTATRYKILIESKAFPSDRYAVVSQLKFHGYDPDLALIEAPLTDGKNVSAKTLSEIIENEGDSIALVLIGGVNYYTGQAFDMETIAGQARERGAVVGFDLAHAAGNLILRLHDWGVDFAAWCSYKYLNAGPGGVAGIFVHERHAENKDLPRFAGWWGHDKATRFAMPPDFKVLSGAEGWQLSNPPIFQLAALKASLDIFDEVGMEKLRAKSDKLTGFLAYLVKELNDPRIESITPEDARGAQLSLRVKENGKRIYQFLTDNGVVCDWREPDVIRVAPVPLYNSFSDVYQFVQLLKNAVAV